MKDNINMKFLEKAAQQALCEFLGFDEGRAYYFILTNKEEELDSEFSYSKKYRIMKSLFEQGAMAKFKPKDKDCFSYILLPPSFLSLNDIDKDIIGYLECIYLKNHSELLKQGLDQIMLKDERAILLFLLKYFMKDNAKVIAEELNIKKLLGEKSRKIDIINKNEEKRRAGLIDKQISYEFVKIPAVNEREYIGYISNNAKEEAIMH